MADTGREAIGRFFESHRKAALRLAYKLGALYPEDAVQAAMVLWLARKDPGRIDLASFTWRLRAVLHHDKNIDRWIPGGKKYRESRPDEVHGDIDRLVRLEHGGRVAPKKGAD